MYDAIYIYNMMAGCDGWREIDTFRFNSTENHNSVNEHTARRVGTGKHCVLYIYLCVVGRTNGRAINPRSRPPPAVWCVYIDTACVD